MFYDMCEQADDADTYCCVAMNDGGQIQTRFQLDVLRWSPVVHTRINIANLQRNILHLWHPYPDSSRCMPDSQTILCNHRI